MKKLLVLGLAIITFIACQNQPQRYFDESPEIETLKAGIAAYEAQDWDKWKANFADTAKIFHNSNKGLSPDDMKTNMMGMLSTLSSYGFGKQGEVTEMVIDKNDKKWVNYWGNWQGKLKANDKVISIPVHLTAQFIDGKMVQEYAYYDLSGYTSAMQEIEAAKQAEAAASEESTEE